MAGNSVLCSISISYFHYGPGCGISVSSVSKVGERSILHGDKFSVEPGEPKLAVPLRSLGVEVSLEFKRF